MSNSWKKWGHGKKSIFRRFSESVEFHIPPVEVAWKFFIHPRQTPKFIPKFEKETVNELTNIFTKIEIPILIQEDIKQENIKETSIVKVNTSSIIEMVPEVIEDKSKALIIPKFHVERKDISIPWIPIINIKRKVWNVPLPKIKWKMPLLKKLALTGVIIIFPLLLLSAGFLIYTVKDMYDNGFVKDVIRYKLDEKLKNSEDKMQSQINDLKTKTDELDAYKQTIYQIKWVNKYRYYDVKGKRARISANQNGE